MKYSVNFDDLIITPTTEFDYSYRFQEQFDTFQEAKNTLVSYWQSVCDSSKANLVKAKQMKP